jgi:hypothetical protein
MYSPEDIYKLASTIWSDPEDIAQFTAMAMGESGGDETDIAEPTYETDEVTGIKTLTNRGGDTGLWQIHPMHFDPTSPKYIKKDDKYQHDLVDLGIVSSHEAAQQELLDPKINALAAKAIARNNDHAGGGLDSWDWETNSLIVSDKEIDWDTFPPTTFYGRGNQDFGLFLDEAREFGQAYASSLTAQSNVAPTPKRKFAPGMEEAVRSVVGTEIPIGPGTIGRGEMSLVRRTMANLDMPEEIIEMFGKGLVALLPPEYIRNVPKAVWARAGLEIDSKFPFIVTPISAKPFDLNGDIRGQLYKHARGLINGIGNWFVEELGDGTHDADSE